MRKLFGKREVVELIEIDELYKETIIHLPVEARIHYCDNLIGTCILDVNQAKGKAEKEKIYQLMNAAKREIERLR